MKMSIHLPALKMIKELCGENELKWEEATECGSSVIKSRISFWDNILDQINNN